MFIDSGKMFLAETFMAQIKLAFGPINLRKEAGNNSF
jgi:hypothetical protein